jgi:hypothetical protein
MGKNYKGDVIHSRLVFQRRNICFYKGLQCSPFLLEKQDCTNST